jgi:hypothetical protein
MVMLLVDKMAYSEMGFFAVLLVLITHVAGNSPSR